MNRGFRSGWRVALAGAMSAAVLLSALASRLLPGWIDAGPARRLLVSLGMDAPPLRGAEDYFQRVAGAIERIPYRIGPWLGRDVETQPAAVRLLRPNKLMQRRYTDPATGEDVSLLLVHCGDVRDMAGHYPPVCYPAHGWKETASADAYETIQLLGQSARARVYRFTQRRDGVLREMSVVNFFVLPGGESHVTPDMDDLERATQRRASATLGSAQVQILTSERMTGEQRREVVGEFVRAIEPSLREVARGVEP